MKFIPTAFAVATLAVQAAAQSPIYGYQDLSFPNRSGQGSANLTTRVYYPATTTGQGVAIKPRSGGHPVIVMLHGFSLIGLDYQTLGRHFADKGYVVVLPNTARLLAGTQVDDALALFPALKVANASGFLKGALDVGRIGLAGHSMGGKSTFDVLAKNPGYRCGLGIAPIDAGSSIKNVTVPVGVLHGKGDWVLGWRSHGLATYQAAERYSEFKFLYLMNTQCGHNNIAGLFQITSRDQWVWARSARIIEGFFDTFLEMESAGVEEVAGERARSASLLDKLYLEVERPASWVAGTSAIGQTVRLCLLCEPGTAILATALKTASIPLPFGRLQLDPSSLLVLHQGPVSSSRLLALPINIPNDAALRGARFPLQGLGLNKAGDLRISGLSTLAIQ